MSIARARELRRNATDAERKLWAMLKPLRSQGYHFRRQVPIGPYYADFACHHAKLIIELDGDQHGMAAQAAHDRRRDAFLRSAGYTMLRMPNGEVHQNMDGVSETIFAILRSRLKATSIVRKPIKARPD